MLPSKKHRFLALAEFGRSRRDREQIFKIRYCCFARLNFSNHTRKERLKLGIAYTPSEQDNAYGFIISMDNTHIDKSYKIPVPLLLARSKPD
jgi:hypothetical protein